MRTSNPELTSLAEIINGYTVRAKVIDDPSGRFRLLGMQDLHAETIALDQLPRLTPDRQPESFVIQPEDVLFVSRGNHLHAHHPALPADNLIPMAGIYMLRPATALLPGYLTWALNQPSAQAQVESLARGTNIRHISMGSLGQVTIPLPPISTQRAIAKLDSLATQEAHLLSRLQQLRRTYINHCCEQALKPPSTPR